ncbi:MAG TPA: hypothetical protein VE127_00170 [Solirubrobacteraceae bacterium]|nr:hypothetical protein [Solirubrobacteraceae bacterium]
MVESLRRRADRFGLDIILVNVWEGVGAAEEARRYCEMWGIEATVLLDEAAEYARALGVRGVPTNVFVDERGIVQAFGATTEQDMLQTAARLAPELLNDPGSGVASVREPSGFAEPAFGDA